MIDKKFKVKEGSAGPPKLYLVQMSRILHHNLKDSVRVCHVSSMW